MPVKLVEVTRSNLVESIHRGDVVIARSDGSILYSLGDQHRLTFLRSASKPIQAIAALEAGIVEKFGLDLWEVALMTASHSGEKQHIEVADSIMKKIGIDEEQLECGIHEPLGKEAAKELSAAGKEPSKLHCNCSGKHLGIIAAAIAKGLPVKNYSQVDHPIQKDVERVVSHFSSVEENKIIKGSDGCGITVYGIPLMNMALAYANLCDNGFMDGKYAKSQNYVQSSMTMYPEMVSGVGRIDYELMKNFGDRVIGKIGAEGVYCAGIIGKSIGIAIKIDDGNNRAAGPAILQVLLQLKVINSEEIERLKEFYNPDIVNHKGEKVGEIRAVFKVR
ncbi:MAG: asparaginase [Clostridia bacterium]|nr:asparaginase [Clostridia bacterium]